jgi:hypothetical protein
MKTTFNTTQFFDALKSLENKDLYFSGSEYSWASDDDLDDTYGDFVCSYDDFVDAVTDYVDGNNKTIGQLIKINGADIDDINKMISNEQAVVELEELS